MKRVQQFFAVCAALGLIFGLVTACKQPTAPGGENNTAVSAVTITGPAGYEDSYENSVKSVTAGETIELSAEVFPASATNKAVTWSLTGVDIVTLASEGLGATLTIKDPVTEGTATVTATTADGNKPATYNITFLGNYTTENLKTNQLRNIYFAGLSGENLTSGFPADLGDKIAVSGDGASVSFDGTYMTLNDPASTTGNLEVTFPDQTTGIVKVSFTMKHTAVNNGWTLVQLRGKDSANADAEFLGVRTDGSNYKLRTDGGSTYTDTSEAVSADLDRNGVFVINIDTGAGYLQIDGSTPVVVNSSKMVNGTLNLLRFVGGGSASRNISVKNVKVEKIASDPLLPTVSRTDNITSITFKPTSLDVMKSADAVTKDLTVTVNNTATDYELNWTNLPEGVTVALKEGTPLSALSTYTVSVASTATKGSCELTATAKTAGTHSANLSLRVRDAGEIDPVTSVTAEKAGYQAVKVEWVYPADPLVTGVNIYVDGSTTPKAVLKPTTEQDFSDLTEDKEYSFEVKSIGTDNALSIGVTATAIPSQALSADVTLTALAVKAGTTALTLSPTFTGSTTTYTATAGSSVSSVTVEAELPAGATAQYQKDSGTAGTSNTIELNAASSSATTDTVIKVIVTAEDGSTTKTYEITVTRAQIIDTELFIYTKEDDAPADGLLNGKRYAAGSAPTFTKGSGIKLDNGKRFQIGSTQTVLQEVTGSDAEKATSWLTNTSIEGDFDFSNGTFIIEVDYENVAEKSGATGKFQVYLSNPITSAASTPWGSESRLVAYKAGTKLSNAPTGTELGASGTLAYKIIAANGLITTDDVAAYGAKVEAGPFLGKSFIQFRAESNIATMTITGIRISKE